MEQLLVAFQLLDEVGEMEMEYMEIHLLAGAELLAGLFRQVLKPLGIA
jgi:hypothetical protein